MTSLVLALTFTPVLAEKLIRSKKKTKKGFEKDEKVESELKADEAVEMEESGFIMRFIEARYESVLRVALNNYLVVLALAVVVFAGAYFFYSGLGSEFLPPFDEGAFVLDYIAPPGTSLEETDKMLTHVEELLKETPEVESWSRRTGLQLGLSITEPNTGDFLVKLKQKRSRTTEEVTDELRGKLETSEPSLQVEFVGILSDLIGDLTSSPAPIEIQLFSEDKTALHQTATLVEESIKKVPGVVDTNNGVIVSGAAVTFKVNPEAASRFGVSPNDIANTVTIAMSGDATSSILEKGKLVAVRVIVPNSDRTSLEPIKSITNSIIHRTTFPPRTSCRYFIRHRTNRDRTRRTSPIGCGHGSHFGKRLGNNDRRNKSSISKRRKNARWNDARIRRFV